MSDVRPELSQLSVELTSLTWGEVMSMAVQLGVDFSTLQQIKEDNSEQNVRLLAAMNDWLSNDHEASWKKVVGALRTIDKNVLADELEKKYCRRSTKTSTAASQSPSRSLTTKPTLPDLFHFKTSSGPINIMEQIGTHHSSFGIMLLNDGSGAVTSAIATQHHYNAVAINREILTRWLQGAGRQPVTWSTLIGVLKDVELRVLAQSIERNL